MSHIDPGERARVARSREYRETMDKLKDHPYGREADELINLVFDSGPSSPRRKLAVAEWLREYVAALSFGCTGLTADPDGPALRPPSGPESDSPASGTEDRPEDYWRDARKPTGLERDGEELWRPDT